MTEPIKVMTISEMRAMPRTLDALPENTIEGTSVTVLVCAEPGSAGPCRILVGGLVTGPADSPTVVDEGGTCPQHGRPNYPQWVTVPSAWDGKGNRTMTHSMWRQR